MSSSGGVGDLDGLWMELDLDILDNDIGEGGIVQEGRSTSVKIDMVGAPNAQFCATIF